MAKKKNPENPLARIAAAIANVEPVDWEGERARFPDLAAQIDKLQAIEAVARGYRGQDADRAGAAGRSDARTQSEDQAENRSRRDSGPPRTWGPLVVLERMGPGGFADVYRAYHTTLRCEVALKLPRADKTPDDLTVKRFLDEASRLAQVRHENLLTVHGADVHDGLVGLWTDLVRGQNLEKTVESLGKLGAREAATVGISLCCGLAALHGAGLLHLDITPANVMREEGGRIILADFGSCREIPGPAGRPDDLCVTLRATAPEVLRGEPPTAAADLYSLGVLLYWLVSKRYPVEGGTLEELRAKHERGDRVPLLEVRPDLPMEFAEAVERALALEPKDRYSGPAEMARVLAALFGPTPPPPPTPHSSSWHRGLAWAGCTAAGALAATAVWWWVNSFRFDATLFREATPSAERVSSGGRVHTGDDLFLEIEGSKTMYVYVLGQDEKGTSAAMFPASTDVVNPLRSSVRHRLPGKRDGQEQVWPIATPGGRETILVIAAPEPLDEVQVALAELGNRGIGTISGPALPRNADDLARFRHLVAELKERGVEVKTREMNFRSEG